MKITVDPASFRAERETTQQVRTRVFTTEHGTVTLNLPHGPVTADANRDDYGEISVRGFVGRYLTSAKPWRATVRFSADGTLRIVHFGRDDRSGRFNKQNAISYEPDTYWAA